MENITNEVYQYTFLDQVIIRIDFSEMLSNEKILSDGVIATARQLFPNRRPDQTTRYGHADIQFENGVPGDVKQHVKEGTRLTFHSSGSRRNSLFIQNDAVIFDYSDYEHYIATRNAAEKILSAIFETGDISTKRVGLRFINQYDAPKQVWFQSAIKPFVKREPSGPSELDMIRTLHQFEYACFEYILTLRCGYSNSRYPNPLREDDFILDLDCYSEDNYRDTNGILRFLDAGHDAIQETFEQCITDKLRDVMRK